ncbi:hypothetical protein BJP36_15205 [Moorena producens JHB]|uniref:Uncharacterized protein n=1 Tax=Moorena producens (strain JHB) TaxID=1454205 RepID=A0A1D9G0V0_MOOP1|nr:hypothetical protein [Moorena producens]AOY81050.1 hypothetical protein BJP36_15205 [Moorena producens JHB]
MIDDEIAFRLVFAHPTTRWEQGKEKREQCDRRFGKMEECVRGSCLVGKWSWVRDEIAFGLVFAHPTRSECDRTCLVGKWSWVRDEIAFGLVFAHPTRSECDRTCLVGKWT